MAQDVVANDVVEISAEGLEARQGEFDISVTVKRGHIWVVTDRGKGENASGFRIDLEVDRNTAGQNVGLNPLAFANIPKVSNAFVQAFDKTALWHGKGKRLAKTTSRTPPLIGFTRAFRQDGATSSVFLGTVPDIRRKVAEKRAV